MNCRDELRRARTALPEAMLVITLDIMAVKMLHYVAMHDVLKWFACDGGK